MKRILAYINDDATSTGKALIGAYRASEVDAELEKEVYEKERWIAREAEARAEVARLKALAKGYAKLAYDYMRHVEDTHPQWLEDRYAEIEGG